MKYCNDKSKLFLHFPKNEGNFSSILLPGQNSANVSTIIEI